MDERLIALLACPQCKAPLTWRPQVPDLLCRGERLAFPVRDRMAVLLLDEARSLADAEEIE